MTSTALIRCEHLHHVYARGNVTALNNINLEIQPREIIGIIGQNGSGEDITCQALQWPVKTK